MSRAYLSYLANLFDSSDHSDCTVSFCIEVDGPPAPKRPRTRKSTAQCQADAGRKRISDLSAHVMVLCGGSDHFSELVRSWREDHPYNPHQHQHQHHQTQTQTQTYKRQNTNANSNSSFSSAATAAAVNNNASSSAAGVPQPRPELVVILSSAADLPHARAAIRFIYTGKLPRQITASELLLIRRQAVALRIKGCVDKCDDAVATRAATTAGVTELYGSRHLLPPDEPSTLALLAACRKQLTRNCAAYLATLQPASAMGELLAWLFPDAPSVLSNPDVRRQMQALPTAALEALLRSDAFATDNEASVLLLLGYWLQANNGTTGGETRSRLCHLIRLSHLNTAYLHGLLPKIAWFPLSREEHQFLCQYVAESEGRRRKSLAAAAAGKHDTACLWYSAARRPEARADVDKPYEWSIKLEDLAADLDLATAKIPNGLTGTFDNGASRLVANGFEFYPGALWFNADGKPEAVLTCAVPAPFAGFTSAEDVVGVASAAAKLSVFAWREVARGAVRRVEATVKVYGTDEPVSVTSGGQGGGSEWHLAVFGKNIDKAPGASARLLPEHLAPYLHEGKLSGALTFIVE